MAPPLALLMDKVAKRYRRFSHRVQESGGRLLQAADQTLNNQQEVKIYGAQGAELSRYAALADENLRLAMKVESTRSISSAVVQLMGAIGLALLLFSQGAKRRPGG